jgi:hypothetical protein
MQQDDAIKRVLQLITAPMANEYTARRLAPYSRTEYNAFLAKIFYVSYS